jgi:hypothetical protein
MNAENLSYGNRMGMGMGVWEMRIIKALEFHRN